MNSTTLDNALKISNGIWRTSCLLCTLFGIPGHLFQIIIALNKTNRKEAISLYYIAIPVVETIFLFAVFWLWCARTPVLQTDPREILSCGIFYSILVGPTILSNLYLASMCFDHAMMIFYPIRYRLILTHRHITIRLILILILIVIFLIPYHYYYYYDKLTTLLICQFYTFIDHWRIRLGLMIHASLFIIIPSLITCISSIILLINRSNHQKKYPNNLSDYSRRMKKKSLIRVFISIATFFSILPVIILEVFIVRDHLFHNGHISSINWKTYKILLNCFLIFGSLNYSLKFYFRLIVSETFRQDFIQLFHSNQQYTSQINKQNRTKTTDI